MEYLEGEAYLGMDGKTLEVGERGFHYLLNILLRGSTGGGTIQVTDMGPQIFDGEETQGGTYIVINKGEVEDGKVSVVRVLA